MAIEDAGSRYRSLPTVTVPGANGQSLVLGVPRVVLEPPTAGSYKVRSGDRLDLMAERAYGDSTQWWKLADANPWADATQVEVPGQIIGLPNA